MTKPADEQQVKQTTPQAKAPSEKQVKDSPHDDGKLKDGTNKDGKLKDGKQKDPERKKKKRSHRSGSKRRKNKGSKHSHKKKHKRRIINIEIIKSPGKPDVVVPPPPVPPQQAPPAPKEVPDSKKEKHSKRKKSKSSSSSSSSSSSEDEKKKEKKKSERKVAPAKEQKSPQPMIIGVVQMPQPDANRNNIMSPVQQNPQVVMISPAQPITAPKPADQGAPKTAEPQTNKSAANESASKAEREKCKPDCDCMDCVTNKAKVRSERSMLNEWTPFHIGAPFPNWKCVQALDRPLNTLPGENPEQFVAMAYIQGEAIMGRVWKDAQGKVAASFSRGGREFKGNVGSIEILLENPDKVRGFDYGWRDYNEVIETSDNKEWKPIHVNHVCPCVMTIDGKEVLGRVEIRNERALVGHNGVEKVLLGSVVTTTKVLCRKAKPGYTLSN